MDVRSKVLQSAARLLARHGFDGTSIQAIADEVGITKPSVLYHFPSKEALRVGVLDDLFEHWARTLPQLLQAVTHGNGRFDALMDELLSFFRKDEDRARLLIREILDRPEETRARLTSTLKPWITLIADYMRKGQEAGQVRRGVDPESYVLHVITLTVTTIATFSVITPTIAGTADTSFDTAERHFRELLRITRTSLYRPKKAKGTDG